MMSRPKMLDTYSCAGGAGMGYHLAGFEVFGLDREPQPRYPFEFRQGDALEALGNIVRGEPAWPGAPAFDAIHASPPCQDHMRKYNPHVTGTGWLLPATRQALQATGLPWIIENVPGAEMRVDIRLCGCMFGLPNLRRERWFETSWHAYDLRSPCLHLDRAMSVTGTNPGSKGEKELFGRWPNKRDWERAMGITWMSTQELTQAIPPPYTEYVGRLLLEHLTAERAA